MAQRPVFLPFGQPDKLVDEVTVEFLWHKGMAASQKRKNVAELHGAALKAGLGPLLEVSTKSDVWLGHRLSAFNLQVELQNGIEVPLESAFQSSKVFSGGGPYTDLLRVDGRTAKRDERLNSSGTLEGFLFEGISFPLVPRTAFYDWLYIRAASKHADLCAPLDSYAGFTDIEFNPSRSINCQARSCATFVSLARLHLLESVTSPAKFLNVLSTGSAEELEVSAEQQETLFS